MPDININKYHYSRDFKASSNMWWKDNHELTNNFLRILYSVYVDQNRLDKFICEILVPLWS
jgi:hypothetical protein